MKYEYSLSDGTFVMEGIPYTISSFFENIKKHGIKSALNIDAQVTSKYYSEEGICGKVGSSMGLGIVGVVDIIPYSVGKMVQYLTRDKE